VGALEIFMKLSRKLRRGKKVKMKTELLPQHAELVEIARQELQTAQSLFNYVTENDLIDHAIFKMNAAERRYIFLLKEARSQHSHVLKKFEEGGTPIGGQ
jgi:hypothetical protein